MSKKEKAAKTRAEFLRDAFEGMTGRPPVTSISRAFPYCVFKHCIAFAPSDAVIPAAQQTVLKVCPCHTFGHRRSLLA
jgi:hypothetical protein